MELPLTIEGSRDLRRLIRQRYAWPGGYEIFFHTSDGGVLCVDCARSNYREIAAERRMKVSHGGWMILSAETTEYLSESCICDHCGRELCPHEDFEAFAHFGDGTGPFPTLKIPAREFASCDMTVQIDGTWYLCETGEDGLRRVPELGCTVIIPAIDHK